MNQAIQSEITKDAARHIPLPAFVGEFSNSLMDSAHRQNPPVYDGAQDPALNRMLDALLRTPFPAQRERIHAVYKLLLEQNEPAAVINAEMGTGKTMMGICLAAIMRQAGFRHTLVISPPHLVYKWRREILETIPDARVWVLNGPDTLAKLLRLRQLLKLDKQQIPEFFIIGRVRMRLGYLWEPRFWRRKTHVRQAISEQDDFSDKTIIKTLEYAACPRCGDPVTDEDGEPLNPADFPEDKPKQCAHCGEALWTLVHKRRGSAAVESPDKRIRKALCQIPTIGPKTADKLVTRFGDKLLTGMLADNVHEFINLMDENGQLLFSDRQAQRMERALGRLEFSFGQGNYQATEFFKRYLPSSFLDLLIVDEGHEYKNAGSAQGQAMAVLSAKAKKVLLLTGTLMGGYADDLFYLLMRVMPQRMIEDGFRYADNGSLAGAAMAFMQEHGVLKHIFKENEGNAHRTARGRSITHRVAKAPGFGPKGIARFVLPYTVFLKLSEIGGDVLPPYDEYFTGVPMEADQAAQYDDLSATLSSEMKEALRKGDTSLLGVVLNVLLAWPDTAFREEIVKHPRTREVIAYAPPVLDDAPSAKENALLDIIREEKSQGRRVLVYTTYTGVRDTATRLKRLCDEAGVKAVVMRASVQAARREEWILDHVDKGIDVLICNPELVKTGLDLLEFPTIVFMQTGYNVFTLMQAARRSWRIGQKHAVRVHFLGYEETAQMACLELMAKKIAVTQSTSGDMPESGLDILNQSDDSMEIALAKQLVA